MALFRVKHLRHTWQLTLILCSTVSACGDSGAGTNAAADAGMTQVPTDLPVVATGDTAATGDVGEQGGVLRLNGNEAVLVVPASILSATTELAISSSATLPAGVPAGPSGTLPMGAIVTTEPHGTTFSKPVQLRIPAPASLPSDAVSLFTQAGDQSAWVEHANVTFGAADGLAIVSTNHFSHWAWFRKQSTSPAAISESAVLDTTTGWAYYGAYNPPGKHWEVRRASLAAGAPYETLFAEQPDEPATLSVMAADSRWVFFYRKKDRTIVRMKPDGSDLQLGWATINDDTYSFKTGLLTTNTLLSGNLRIALDSGQIEHAEFGVAGNCAITPDESRIACRGQELVLATGTVTTPRDGQGFPTPNGDVVTDGHHWYFLSSELDSDGHLNKMPYGGTASTRIATFDKMVDKLAISGTKLFVGNDSTIIAVDSETGTELGRVSLNIDQGSAAHALLKVDATTIYYAGWGTTMQRLAISDMLR